MRKIPVSRSPLLLFVAAVAAGTARAQAPTPNPGGGMKAMTASEAPPGAPRATIEDLKLAGPRDDPFEMERYGLAALQAKDLGKARIFFEKSWSLGELPTAAYNLACLQVREKKVDSAWGWLEKAVTAGFDDEATLAGDPDLQPLRGQPRFARIVARVKKNRAAGDAASLSEAILLPPKGRTLGFLVLVHDRASDPLRVAAPFTALASREGLFLVVPRGPSPSAKKRFGWGSAERAFSAIDAALIAARLKVGNPKEPAFVAGVGFGGTLALAAAAHHPGVFAGAASIGGEFSPAVAPGGAVTPAGLRGIRVFLGIPRDAPPMTMVAFREGIEALRRAGLEPRVAEWPGAGTGFPNDVGLAVRETLAALLGS